jgi:hypothetical protein
LKSEKVQPGNASGNAVKVREWKYRSISDGSKTVYPVWKEIVYLSDSGGGSSSVETVYEYPVLWAGVQVKDRLTTLPAVSTAQNGSNSSNVQRDQFDESGFLTWHQDEAGRLTRFSYDLSTGAITHVSTMPQVRAS